MRLIRAGDFDGGIGELKEAQRVFPHPYTVFNIARANEDAGHREEAVRWYRAYLETQPPDREAVEAKLRRLEQK
jgi:predicted TPR repeat methyltransferase